MTLLDDRPQPLLTSVAGCELLRSCRILRLPQVSCVLLPYWLAYLDDIVTQRTDSTLPHTLSVNHRMDAAAAEHLIASPPSRSLSIGMPHGVCLNIPETELPFVIRADRSPQLVAQPRQLHLSITCDYWSTHSKMQPFIDLVMCRQRCLRSITLPELPRLEQVTREVLAAVSHCTNLQTLSLSAMKGRRRLHWLNGPTSQTQRTHRPQLSHLHTLTLTELKGARTKVCHLLSACPSLQVCVIRLRDVTVGMLRLLASSSQRLTRLQLQSRR